MTRDEIAKMAHEAGLANVRMSAGLESMRTDMWVRFAALVAAAEREACAPDKHGMKNLICPRCGGHSYYKLDDPAQATKGE